MPEVENAQAVINLFGRWPSFHDAEVLRLRLESHRGEFDAEGRPRRPTLEADIHVFESTDRITSEGFYELQNHTLVTLAFEGIGENRIEGFAFQNVLLDLEFEETRAEQSASLKWKVFVDPSAGVKAAFSCEAIRVVDAIPFEPKAI
jgi:hypothetical protein